jgi:hypothetical protein
VVFAILSPTGFRSNLVVYEVRGKAMYIAACRSMNLSKGFGWRILATWWLNVNGPRRSGWLALTGYRPALT